MKKLVRLLKQFRLDTTPRAVGNPHQHIALSPKQFLMFMKWNNGRKTCYTSHNGYTEFDEHDNPTHVKTRNLFLDFDMDEDNGKTFEKTARDAKLVSEYLSDENIAHSIAFSGRAGYHVYLHLKPSIETLKNGLSMKYKNIYAHLHQELNLMTLDQRCADSKRLCRVPGTIYSKEENVSDRKCIPVHSPISNKEEIYEKSRKPISMDDYVHHGDKYTIDELIDKWDIKSETFEKKDLYGTVKYDPPFNCDMAGEFFRPCIKNMLFTSNPPHFIRVSACAKIRRIGFSLDKAIQFFDMLSRKCGWIDRENKNKRDYNIKHIYKRGYEMPKCHKIMFEGYCVGEECEYYNDVKNGDDE